MGEQEVNTEGEISCYSNWDRVNEKYVSVIEMALCSFLGHNLVPLAGKGCVGRAKQKAEEITRTRQLDGCESNFLYSRLSVNFDGEAGIERGLRKIVEKWIGKHENFIRSKDGISPYIILHPSEGGLTTICVAAYFE